MGDIFETGLNDIRTSKRNVNRYLGVWLLFAFIAYMYIIEPYLWYKTFEHQSLIGLNDLHKNNVRLSDKHEHIGRVLMNVEIGLKDIERQLHDYPIHLQEIILQIKTLGLPTDTRSKVGSFQPPDGIETPGKVIVWYINAWFGNLIDRLKIEVADPISKLENGQYKDSQSKLNEIIQNVKSDLSDFLVKEISPVLSNIEDSDLIDAYKGFVVSEVQPKVEKYFLQVKKEFKVDKLLLNVRKKIKEIDHKMAEAKAIIETIQGKLGELEEQFNSLVNSIESPLGKIPVKITDIITLYPFFMIALMVMVTFDIVKSSRLYIFLWQEFAKDKGNADLTVFQQYTDCWYQKAYGDITRGCFLFIPLGISIFIYGRTSWHVFKIPELFPVASSLRRISFLSLYVVGIFVMIGCLYYILKTLRKVSREVTN